MIEFEIPFVCLIFTTLIALVFFTKKKVKIQENYYYKSILIFTLFVHTTNFVSHYSASIYAKEGLTSQFKMVFANINKLGSTFIVFITMNILAYILYISFESFRKKFVRNNFIFGIGGFITGLLIFLLEFEVYQIGGITSGKGSSVTLTFGVAFINLIITFLIALGNIKKYDKRYNAIDFIIPLIFLLGVFVLFHPQFNIYDLILSLLCYIMYFTIENPDIKLLNEVTLAKNELEQANNVKSHFISSMSHEIRTPVNAIVGFSELIDYADTLEEAKENSKDIRNASEDLLKITDQIFSLYALEKENNEIVLERFHPEEIIKSVCDLYKTKIANKQIQFITKINNMPTLIGDKKIIKKIIFQVLDNAYKFTNEGLIELTANYQKEYLEIAIKDTGIGIKESELKDIFIPFKKSTETKNTIYSGIGVGLSITKILLDKIGGNIKIDSKYHKGTEVKIKIKVSEEKK